MAALLHGARVSGSAWGDAVGAALAPMRARVPPGRRVVGLPLGREGRELLATATTTLGDLAPAGRTTPTLAWRSPSLPATQRCQIPRAWRGMAALLVQDGDFSWAGGDLVGPATRALAGLAAMTGSAGGAHAGGALLDEAFAAALLLFDARRVKVRGLAAPPLAPRLLLGAWLPRPSLAAAAAVDRALARRWLPHLTPRLAPAEAAEPPLRATLPPRPAGQRLLLPPPSHLARPLGPARAAPAP